MRRTIGYIFETLGGTWVLFTLVARTRFRLRGAYWTWRKGTAFGGGEPEPGERWRMTLDYARWAWRMRRHT